MSNEPAPNSIDANQGQVLPVLPYSVLETNVLRLTPCETRDLLQHKLVPAAWLPNATYYAAGDDNAVREARRRGMKLVGQVHSHDLRRVIKRQFGPKLINEATFQLARRLSQFSAATRLTAEQVSVIAVFIIICVAGSFINPSAVLVGISVVFGVFFLSLIALRIMCLLPQDQPFAPQTTELGSDELPVYSVLVPLFRETSVLRQLVGALSVLDYPVGQLDIKLVLEEEDIAMQRAVSEMRLQHPFDVIVVPAGKPQTKPRALNYALNFCRGELVTIYDAEDLPDPAQLRLSAETFASVPPHIACLQAQLTFFNCNESWLTRQFSIEYATLFRIMLPALAAEELPLPLGGTSNHFRRDILESIGGWDPFNVTEDADIGMRLARVGYRTGTLENATQEEANTIYISWIKQRSRWLKGFLQTWLVHMRSPWRCFRELGPGGFWVLQAATLGVFLSALLHPILLGHALYVLAAGRIVDNQSLLSTGLAGLNLSVLVLGYLVTGLLGRRAMRGLGLTREWWALATLPLYWFMMMPAAWLALWDFMVKPFDWRKTAHGHSRQTPTTGAQGQLTEQPSP
jgi:glycosyltransferase XagB